MVIHAAIKEISLSKFGDGWFKLSNDCSIHPAPESNPPDSGQVRLLQPAIIHTYLKVSPKQQVCLIIFK